MNDAGSSYIAEDAQAPSPALQKQKRAKFVEGLATSQPDYLQTAADQVSLVSEKEELMPAALPMKSGQDEKRRNQKGLGAKQRSSEKFLAAKARAKRFNPVHFHRPQGPSMPSVQYRRSGLLGDAPWGYGIADQHFVNGPVHYYH